MDTKINQTISSHLFAYKESIFFNYFDLCPFPWEVWEHLIAKFFMDKIPFSQKYSGVFFLNKSSIYIEEGVKIAKGATIEGPCYLGKNVTIGTNVSIRAGTFLAPNVCIGHCSEIVRSIFFEGAKAAHFNYVGDSVIGKNVNLGAQAVLANLVLW
jgi:NDP-sugar pyrophosphorylase family protein